MPPLVPVWLSIAAILPGFAEGLVAPIAQAEPEPLAPVRPRPATPATQARRDAPRGALPETQQPESLEAQQAPPAMRIAMVARGGYRLAPASDEVPPALGFGFALAGEVPYARAWDYLQLGVGIDFSFNLHEKDATGTEIVDGQAVTFDAERIIMDNQFVLLQTVGVQLEQWRPFAALGAGLALGYFSSEEAGLDPGEQRALRPMARAAVGIDYDYGMDAYFGVRADYSRMLTNPKLQTTSGRQLTIFGDLFTFGVVIGNRFH